MKISDLIKELEKVIEDTGDHEVYVESYSYTPIDLYTIRSGLMDICFRFIVYGDKNYNRFCHHISRITSISYNR